MIKPQHVFFLLLSCVVLLVAGGSGAYYISHARLHSKIEQTEQLKAKIITARERLDNLESLQQSYTMIQPLEDKMDRMVPSEKQQAEVTAMIFSMMENSGVQGGNLSFEATQGLPSNRTQTVKGDVEGVRVMPIRFGVRGSYRQLQTFLRHVERQERLMQVTSLTIQRDPEKEDLSFNVQLEVFVKNADSQAN